ncbi:hypothetical protein EMWEY_00031770 [Eimeria maxima]|uniref:Uncharacterized protein n=1 Tax=Eimeria maxima TaxID=5804 RepID=U6MDP1_EIMMA|nr:hypothetical protein EMWEY_00031770 [Eimeria maxima]CDJ60549.1 hypothetical protein EMWEY_00031770 [Eimeria maxima]
MEAQRKDAGTILSDGLRSQRGVSGAIYPAGTQNAENNNKTAPEYGKIRSRMLVARQLFAVFSLLLLSGVLFRVYGKLVFPKLSSPMISSHSESDQVSLSGRGPLSHDGDTTRGCLDVLKDAAAKLKKPWISSEQPMQAALPSNDGEALTEDQLLTNVSSPILSSHSESDQVSLSGRDLLSLDSGTTRGYFGVLKDFAQKLKKPWRSSEQPVQEAPSSNDGEALTEDQLLTNVSSPMQSSHSESTQVSRSGGDPLSDDDHTIREYLEELKDAEEKMNNAWKSSEGSVKDGFQNHFTPSSDIGQALTEDPLATIKDHVAKMRTCEFPSVSSPKLRSDFLHHVQLLLSICRMATLRLEHLKWHESVKNDVEAPSSSPAREKPGSNSGPEDTSSNSSPTNADGVSDGKGIVGSEQGSSVDGRAAENNDLEEKRGFPVHEEPGTNPGRKESSSKSVTPDDLLAALGMVGTELGQPLESEVAHKLLFQLALEEKRNDCNLEARHYFELFLQPSGEEDACSAIPPTAEHEIPYSGKPFRTGTIAQAAAQLFGHSEDTTNYAKIRRMHSIVRKWTNDGVKEVTKQQKDRNADKLRQRQLLKKEQMRMLLEQGIQMSDLEMTALFLL